MNREQAIKKGKLVQVSELSLEEQMIHYLAKRGYEAKGITLDHPINMDEIRSIS